MIKPSHLADFFLTKALFSFFYLQIFRSTYLQYGHIWYHIWYHNNGNEMFYQTIRFIVKNVYSWIFCDFFFITLRYIFCHSDLDLRPKVTNLIRVRASAISNYLAKAASKLMNSFGWNFVHRHTHKHTHSHTHRQTDKLK